MNGAIAEPWLKTIIPPNKTRTIIIGNNQYFFLTFKNSQNSFINSILELILHSIIFIIFFNPISFPFTFF